MYTLKQPSQVCVIREALQSQVQIPVPIACEFMAKLSCCLVTLERALAEVTPRRILALVRVLQLGWDNLSWL